MIDLDLRAKAVGLSMAGLARRSGIPYKRIWTAARLTPAEVGAIEKALAEAAADEKRTAAGLASAAVKGGAHDSGPRPEA